MKKNFYMIVVTLVTGACADFIEIDEPRTDLVRSTVFASDQTAKAAVTDLYYQMSQSSSFGSGGLNSVSLLTAFSSDEATNRLPNNADLQAFYTNTLLPVNSYNRILWSDMYNTIYKSNAILEGIQSPKLTDETKRQLEGEAKFVRAFCYFYLINLFGDAPLTLTTDYKTNMNIGRTPMDQVYAQIVSDLEDANANLWEDSNGSQDERTRPNKYAAIAMLARVALYRQDWEKAETYASILIENASVFQLPDVDMVFRNSSQEAIWQIYPLTGTPYDRAAARSYSRLQPSLTGSFGPGDLRRISWTQGDISNKYSFGDNSYSEYSMVLRLAEQYLIRAEARTFLQNFEGARDDLNAIRTRAGLDDTPANDKASLLDAIANERRLELFMEWGHRWMDLKRLGKANEILPALKPDWNVTDQLYPIPEAQILNDPAMKNAQNPGY